MFYLSRSEQVALLALLALLLGGAGILTYTHGKRAGRAGLDQSIFLPAPQQPAPRPGICPNLPPAPTTPAAKASPPAGAPIHLNSATAADLEALPGIGPVLAQNIITYRERKIRDRGCGFQSVDELLNVPGIGPKRFTAIRERVLP